MSFLEALLNILALLLLIPCLIVFIQSLFARFHKGNVNNTKGSDKSIAVLIPAHNESSGIIPTLNSICSQLGSQDRVIVVADNCDDDTAEIASKNGAEVVQRNDLKNRGKGYALDFGIKHLSKSPPDVVIIIDADCIVEENVLKRLAELAFVYLRPIQALYLMYSRNDDIKSKVSEFAWIVKNLVRPLGYANLGFPCQLMGTGMAFKWSIISETDLANGNIVEDMKLGIDLALAGSPPLFDISSQVISYFPLDTEVSAGQRKRWEHGHLAMILTESPRLFLGGLRKRDISLVAMAFDLLVPPLALLVIFILSFTALTGVIYFVHELGGLAFILSMLAFVLLTFAISIAWLGWGRNIISLRDLFYVPIYIIKKLPHYFKFLSNRQNTWNKTNRD